MKYDFTSTADRTTCCAIKTNAQMIKEYLGLNYYEDTIPMWVADMDFVVAPEIVEAITSRASTAVLGYGAMSDEYYTTLCHWFKKRLGMDFSPQEVVPNSGTVSAIQDTVRAFTAKGDGVIVQPPVYYPFITIPEACGRKVVANNLLLGEDNRYSIDFEDFERKCADPANKLFIYCNPHNPVGQVWSAEDTERLLEICERHDVIFFSDEVHCDILRAGVNFTSALNLNKYHHGLIVATAANKTFNLAGLHITNLIIPSQEVRERYTNYRGMTSANPFSEVAAIAAYGKCEEWVEEMNATLDDNLNYMKEFIEAELPKVRYNCPEGTYLAWLDFRAYGMEEAEVLELCSEKAHLILEGGSMFGPTGTGFIRLNAACPKSLLVEALSRLRRVFAEL